MREAGKHFVLLKDDLSDLQEQVECYSAPPDATKAIIRKAHEWVEMFTGPMKERIIAARVLEKYFSLSGQL